MRRERRKEKKIDRDQEVGKASVLACTSVCTCWREKEREWRAKRREEKGKREQERERERERREQPPMEHTVLPCLELGSGFGLVLVLGLGLRRPRRDFGSNPGEKGLDIELSN